MSELSALAESEGYGACDDELSVFRIGKWETRGRVRTPEALRGIQNIMTMKKSRREEGTSDRDMKKELVKCSA